MQTYEIMVIIKHISWPWSHIPVPVEFDVQYFSTHDLHAVGIPWREGSACSIAVYTISYHNIIVNINVVRYVSVQIMMGRYFNTRGKGVHVVLLCIQYCIITLNINKANITTIKRRTLATVTNLPSVNLE